MTLLKRIIIKYPNFIFWVSFLLLNFLLFVPITFFFWEDVVFWVWKQPPSLTALAPQLFLQRTNLDIFRLNLEWLLLVLVAAFVKPMNRQPMQRRWLIVFTFIFYLIQLSYAAYEGFIRSYYLLDPIFYNDFFLFADGTRYVLQNLHLASWQYVGGILLFLLGIGLLYGLNWLLFTAAASEKLAKGTVGLLVGLFVGAMGVVVWLDGEVGGLETAVSSFTAKINQNVQLSQEAKANAAVFDSDQLAQFYEFTEVPLRDKPDIYVIFVESYGSILYKRADFHASYALLLNELELRLSENDWAAASIQSIAPTWGGGSWISYTSALSGIRLDSHAQYLAMFNRYSNEPFPHLVNYLRDQGYRSYRLSANSEVLNDIEWDRYRNFYGIDEWLRFHDLQYEGPLFGWGPSPPDQYALNFAHDYMNRDAETPHVFFYITQNSHYPWTPLPDVMPDWQAFQNAPPVPPPPAERLPHDDLRRQYMASIEYEMTTMVDFITKEADENDIFVIVGDHQPARVARYADGWETPLHVISKNDALIESFYEFGFVPGLSTRNVTQLMRHEGFYSLFMRSLLQQYGFVPDRAPAYMPNGIPLN